MSFNGGFKRDEKFESLRKKTNSRFIGKKIAIAGYSVRTINLSAKTCGFKTLAIDCFADMDLRRLVDRFIFVNLDEFRTINGKITKPAAYYLFDEIEKNKDLISEFDYFVLGSSFENYPELIKDIQNYDNYLGNSWKSIQKIRSTKKLYPFLMQKHIKFPKTVVFSIDTDNNHINFTIYDFNKQENRLNQQIKPFAINYKDFFNKIVTENFSLPCVLKSEKSGGGFGIYLVKNERDFINNFENLREVKKNDFIIQEFINGKHMSCSFISNGKESKIICFSEQIIGEHKFGCQNDFTYCGNIMNRKISDPNSNENLELTKKIDDIIQKIIKYSELKGSNGLDFVLKRNLNQSQKAEIYFIEINPRFQGTIDLFEETTGLNIMKMHLESILENKLPENIKYPTEKTYLKAIYYSPIDFHILVDLQGLNFRDVPLIGNQIFTGQPLCSTITTGCNEKEAFEKALENRDLIVRVLGLKSRIPSKSEFLM